MSLSQTNSSAKISRMSQPLKAHEWLKTHSQEITDNDPLLDVLTAEMVTELMNGKKVVCLMGERLVEISLDENKNLEVKDVPRV